MTLKGFKQTEETKAKIRAASIGRKHTAEARAKIRQAQTGRSASEATRAKMSTAQRGRRQTPASIEKMRQAKLGKSRSPATIAKLRATALKIAKRGAHSHLWRGGVHLLHRGLNWAIRGLFEYEHWRRQVFLRDNFTCQGCGAVGTMFNAHHIKQFQAIVDRYSVTTLEQAKACAPLWDVDNGVTLCKACHQQVHKKGGHCEQTTIHI